jgi:hypothetical protein
MESLCWAAQDGWRKHARELAEAAEQERVALISQCC